VAQINLVGSIGLPGSTPILGAFEVVFATDTNHMLSSTEFSNRFLHLTSDGYLTAARQLLSPLTPGREFVVFNNTSGGQAITIIGETGEGVSLANGQLAAVICDGYRYRLVLSGNSSPTAQIKSDNYTVQTSDGDIFADLSSAAWTLTLPDNPSFGDKHSIKDHTGNAGTNNLTIAGNSKNIEQTSGGFSTSLLLSANFASITLEYNGTNWSIIL